MEISTTAQHWDRHAEQFAGPRTNRAEWLGCPGVERYRCHLLGAGSMEEWFLRRRPPGAEVMVGIGAGAAAFELNLLAAGFAQRLVVFEVGPALCERAVAAAAERGLADRVEVIRTDGSMESVGRVLARTGCDAVVFRQALHHLADLDGLATLLATHLSPHGVLLADEYVGPSRFAFPDHHVGPARRCYRQLAPHLRTPWPELPLPDPAEVERVDPTEAVRSDELLSFVRSRFRRVEVVPLGGAFAYPLWNGLQHDLLFDTAAGVDLVQHVIEIDAALLQSGRLPTYFAAIAAWGPRA